MEFSIEIPDECYSDSDKLCVSILLHCNLYA